MMEQALKHFEAGEYAEAEAIYRQVLEQDPGHSEAMFLLAQVRQRQGDLEQPLELLEQVSQLEPLNPNVFHARGVLHIKRGEADAARRQFQQALEINPNHVESRNGLAFIELSDGRFPAAEHNARIALSDQPENVRALTYLGTAMLEQGQAAEALPVLQQAVQLEPASLTAQCQLGRALLATGSAGFAVQCFENALQGSAESPDLLEYLGIALMEAGRNDEAAPHLRKAVSNGRANPELFRRLATCEIELGDPAQAEALLEAAHRIAPEDEAAALEYAEILIARDAAETAAAVLQEQISGGSGNERVHALLAQAQLRMGHSSAAVALLEPLMQGDSVSVGTELAYVEALEKDEQQQKADALMAQLMARDPVPAAARLHKAVRLYRAENAECIELLSALTDHEELSLLQRDRVRRMLANALHRDGRYAEAASLYSNLANRYAEILSIDHGLFDEGSEDPTSAMEARLVSGWPSSPPDDGLADPVFVIGWPGCGQERILPALSVHTELAMLLDTGRAQSERRGLINQPRGATALAELGDEAIRAARQAYWTSLRQRGFDPEGLPTIDTMWLTVESLPTIYRLFPRARVLVIQRDPRDMAVYWMQAGYKVLDIMAKAYSFQMQLLNQCRNSVPLNFIDVEYASLERDPESGLRALLEALDLPWQDAVLQRFEETPLQVEAKTGDWQHYAAVKAAAGAAPDGPEPTVH